MAKALIYGTNAERTGGTYPAGTEFREIDTGDWFENTDGSTWLQTRSGGSGHSYGLARNCVVKTAGTYNTTEIIGFVVSIKATGDWSITPKDGVSVTGIDPGTFAAGLVYPIHATSITVGTGGEALLLIP